MYNTDYPSRADLPTTSRLVRSSLIAAISAAGILFSIVLPSEYGVDPTGVGRLLGLTPMGEIKVQLAREAAAELKAADAPTESVSVAPPRLSRLFSLLSMQKRCRRWKNALPLLRLCWHWPNQRR